MKVNVKVVPLERCADQVLERCADQVLERCADQAEMPRGSEVTTSKSVTSARAR